MGERIWHNQRDKQGFWVIREEPLMDQEGRPLWLELPSIDSQRIDVVALPLTQLNDVAVYPHDVKEPDPGKRIYVGPADQVSIIGFPFGRTAGGSLGIWVQGTLASEPAIDFEGLPVQLVDSRTRSGQSGSPVIAYRRPGMAVQYDDRRLVTSNQPAVRFIGVYSGRINEQSDLGRIWKAHVVTNLLAVGNRPT